MNADIIKNWHGENGQYRGSKKTSELEKPNILSYSSRNQNKLFTSKPSEVIWEENETTRNKEKINAKEDRLEKLGLSSPIGMKESLHFGSDMDLQDLNDIRSLGIDLSSLRGKEIKDIDKDYEFAKIDAATYREKEISNVKKEWENLGINKPCPPEINDKETTPMKPKKNKQEQIKSSQIREEDQSTGRLHRRAGGFLKESQKENPKRINSKTENYRKPHKPYDYSSEEYYHGDTYGFSLKPKEDDSSEVIHNSIKGSIQESDAEKEYHMSESTRKGCKNSNLLLDNEDNRISETPFNYSEEEDVIEPLQSPDNDQSQEDKSHKSKIEQDFENSNFIKETITEFKLTNRPSTTKEEETPRIDMDWYSNRIESKEGTEDENNKKVKKSRGSKKSIKKSRPSTARRSKDASSHSGRYLPKTHRPKPSIAESGDISIKGSMRNKSKTRKDSISSSRRSYRPLDHSGIRGSSTKIREMVDSILIDDKKRLLNSRLDISHMRDCKPNNCNPLAVNNVSRISKSPSKSKSQMRKSKGADSNDGRELDWKLKNSGPTIGYSEKRHFLDKDQFIISHHIFPSTGGKPSIT